MLKLQGLEDPSAGEGLKVRGGNGAGTGTRFISKSKFRFGIDFGKFSMAEVVCVVGKQGSAEGVD